MKIGQKLLLLLLLVTFGLIIGTGLTWSYFTDQETVSGSFSAGTWDSGPASPTQGDLVITEFMSDPDQVDDSEGEWFEIKNVSGHDLDLEGVVVKDSDSDSFTISSNTVGAGQYFVLGRNGNQTINGGYQPDYVYSSFVLANDKDEIIIKFQDQEIDRVEYNGGFLLTAGASAYLTDIGSDNNNFLNWALSTTIYGDGDKGTPGY
jgi:predicted ribosomally synthesized peptide with SipW-like signal peptide